MLIAYTKKLRCLFYFCVFSFFSCFFFLFLYASSPAIFGLSDPLFYLLLALFSFSNSCIALYLIYYLASEQENESPCYMDQYLSTHVQQLWRKKCVDSHVDTEIIQDEKQFTIFISPSRALSSDRKDIYQKRIRRSISPTLKLFDLSKNKSLNIKFTNSKV